MMDAYDRVVVLVADQAMLRPVVRSTMNVDM